MDIEDAKVTIDGQDVPLKKLKKELHRYADQGLQALDESRSSRRTCKIVTDTVTGELPATPRGVLIEPVVPGRAGPSDEAVASYAATLPTVQTSDPVLPSHHEACSKLPSALQATYTGSHPATPASSVDSEATDLLQCRSAFAPQLHSLVIALPWHAFLDVWTTVSPPPAFNAKSHPLPSFSTLPDCPWSPLPFITWDLDVFDPISPTPENLNTAVTSREVVEFALNVSPSHTTPSLELDLKDRHSFQQDVKKYFGIRHENQTVQEYLQPYIIERQSEETDRAMKELLSPSSVQSMHILTSYIALLLSNNILSDEAINDFISRVEEMQYLASLSSLFSQATASAKAVASRVLHAAVEIGATNFLANALKNGANTETPSVGGAGVTLLQRALRSGKQPAAKLLIDAGADVSVGLDAWADVSIGFEFSTPTRRCMGKIVHKSDLLCPCRYTGLQSTLRLAAGTDHCVELIPDLLAKGAGLPKCPVLTHAVAHKADQTVVMALITAGADVNEMDLTGLLSWPPYYCPLAAAAKCSTPDVVELLLRMGGDPNCGSLRDSKIQEKQIYDENDDFDDYEDLKLPLFIAVTRHGYGNENSNNFDIVTRLLQYHADPNLSVADLLLSDCHEVLQKSTRAELEDTIGERLRKWLNPWIKEGFTLYPLQEAAKRSDDNMLRIILEAGGLINPPLGVSALAIAIEASNFDTARFLLKNNADPNHRGIEPYCVSPLESAIQQENLVMIDELLARGADVNRSSAMHGGRTPLQRAAERGNKEIIDHLINRGALLTADPAPIEGVSTLQGFVERDLIEYAAKAIQAGVSANSSSKNGRSPLTAAVVARSRPLVTMLLAAGADVHAYTTVRFQDDSTLDLDEQPEFEGFLMSPIQWASFSNAVDMAQILCAAGADVNQPAAPRHGRTALTAAIQQNNFSVLKFLISQDVDLGQNGSSPSSPAAIEFAVSYGSEQMLSMLLRRGEDPNQTVYPESTREDTLLTKACQENRFEIVRCLLRSGADATKGNALLRTLDQVLAQE